MRRPGKVFKSRSRVGKLGGIALAIFGLVIIVALMPATFWWFLAGILLILVGGKLYLG